MSFISSPARPAHWKLRLLLLPDSNPGAVVVLLSVALARISLGVCGRERSPSSVLGIQSTHAPPGMTAGKHLDWLHKNQAVPQELS